MRKGYGDEYRTKQLLIQQYGKDNVIKVAIGSFGADFLILNKGKLVKVVEVKGTRKNAWYPSPREKEQLQRIHHFSQTHNCKAELWIWTKEKGKKELRVVDVKEFVGGDV
ncbi:MAG: hypothetical protein EJNHJLOP_00046 [Methanophagales virus PBV082]|uniref:Holliday junction resolvase n=1 Tax=Methanophagales virus PBV082 TaxID=3071307 RepID=A0AA46TDH5_9VIRU|nr:MAG: hypothetical protein QIT52_gp46 [Methanophagales virus PBV082]UYL64935.1 MAG: hypothetical protein EJNHJLOP_00046 [Methanophagales virus PBV082]